MRDFFALLDQFTRYFHGDFGAGAVAAQKIWTMRGMLAYDCEVIGNHFFQVQDTWLSRAIRREGIKWLVLAQSLGETSAIETTTRPVAVEEKKRRTTAFGLKCNQPRVGLIILRQFWFILVWTFLIHDHRQFLDR